MSVARSFGFRAEVCVPALCVPERADPISDFWGLQVRDLLGGVVVIERIFGIQGMGSLMVDAAFGRDYPTVQACTLTFLLIVLLTNLLVDPVCGRLILAGRPE